MKRGIELGAFSVNMRVFHFRISIILFALGLFGFAACAPDEGSTARPNQDQLTDLDRQITRLQDAIEDGDSYVTSDLNDRMKRDQEMIAALNLEATSEQATQGDDLRVLQFYQQQKSTQLRERLSGLAAEVHAQEAAFAAVQQATALVAAPEESDPNRQRQGQANLAAAAEPLEFARSQYQALLEEYQSSPEAYFADQSRQLNAIRARQSDLSELANASQKDLNAALQAKRQLASEKAERLHQLQTLREQRQRLATASAADSASTTQSSTERAKR